MSRTDLTYFAEVLRANGYVVIPRARHVVLTANYIVPPYAMENLRSGDFRWSDIALETNIRKLARKAFDTGLMIHERQDLDDPVTGREVVFTTAMGCIKPKTDDEV